MSSSTEDRINRVRNLLIEAIMDLAEFQANSHGGAPELDAVDEKLEDVLVEFEKVVNEIPTEVL